MAKRFTKTAINWAELEKRVPIEDKQKYLAFKTKTDMYLRRIQANPSEPPKINWDVYQKLIPIEGLVEKYKSAYTALKVTYPDDTLSSKVDDQWLALEPEIKKFCEEIQKEIGMAQNEIDNIKALPSLEDITLEMYYDMSPNDALDPINRPSFWPHNPEEQLGYEQNIKTVKITK